MHIRFQEDQEDLLLSIVKHSVANYYLDMMSELACLNDTEGYAGGSVMLLTCYSKPVPAKAPSYLTYWSTREMPPTKSFAGFLEVRGHTVAARLL
ncbi:hypothetical protein ElyMa_003429200 [Elysia marginata]|uniref:Uncharacterized protein n=1 Tax=Elysia marginata TaxID=1093978 RepID=A0AAV4JQ82_9GAST|nr:hypothetical protein ElyMa_003429200 [Elysia marginata]